MKKSVAALLTVILLVFSGAYAETNRTVVIESTSNIVYVGNKIKLTARIEGLLQDNGKAKTQLVWTSSEKKIAAVDSQGVVTGLGAGEVQISCHAQDDPGISNSISIEVRASVKKLTLPGKRITLLLGTGEKEAQAVLTPSFVPENAYDKTISWSSSNTAVATVDENGLVQAVSPGKSIIAAKSNDPAMSKAKEATCEVIVGLAVSDIRLSELNITVDKGKTAKLSAVIVPQDAYNKKVNWTSTNAAVAKVDKNGTVSAKSTGNATIVCTADDGSGVAQECKVTVVQKVTKLAPREKRLVLFEGKTGRLSVNISPNDATNKKIKWSSSSAYIASVDENGTVKGNRAGEAVIQAAATDGSGKKASFKVIIEPENPISLESIGHGVYLPNLLALTVKNKTKTKTITNFGFDMELYSYNGTEINSGSYSLGGRGTRVAPKQTKTIKQTAFGVGYASKTVITITSVTFSDGSYHSIPISERETWSFRR